ncbi:MAG: hypothetical protein L6R37_002813 [Teloschistes peruensis]|nr:MAG: hypothetical protein L6R37_002813 [Teloschistes peruensis]
MSGKYTFTKALKEVRFHLCQTSEHSAATSAEYGKEKLEELRGLFARIHDP